MNEQTHFDNVFSIPNAEECHCAVRVYEIGHSEMMVKIDHPADKLSLFVVFFHVEYFSGPLRWKGAGFSTAPLGDALNLLRNTGRYENIPDELLRHFQLYVAKAAAGLEVKILAAGAEMKVVKGT